MAEQAVNGPVWLPQALKTFCLIQFLGCKNSLFPLYWPSGVIRIGLPIWKWKKCKNIWANVAEQDAKGPVGVPQAPNPLYVIFYRSSLFSALVRTKRRFASPYAVQDLMPLVRRHLRKYIFSSNTTFHLWGYVNLTSPRKISESSFFCPRDARRVSIIRGHT